MTDDRGTKRSRERLSAEKLARLKTPKERLNLIYEKSFFTFLLTTIGLISSLILSFYSIKNIVFYFEKFFGHYMQLGSINFLITSAYADDTTSHTAVFSSELRSIIISSSLLGIFILFIWALYTLSRSSNTATISFALDTIKILSGFFIGIITAFLG